MAKEKSAECCDIRNFSDMQKCMKCGMCWDINDPHPPKCEINNPKKVIFLDRIIAFVFGSK